MTEPLAGFDFTIEFSEGFATKALQAIFTFGGVKSRFGHTDSGQPGLITTHQTVGGAFAYQNYLIELEGGYDLALANPSVRFVGGATQAIEIGFDFGVKFRRNLVARIYDRGNADTALAQNPGVVRQDVLYPEAHRTAPAIDPYPGDAAPLHQGRIVVRFPVTQKPFGAGRRVSARTAGTGRGAVVSVTLSEAMDARLKAFIEIVGSKALTELMNREIDDYDLGPLIGDLNAFGLKLRDPVAIRIGDAATQRSLAFAANEYATVGNGDPLKLSYLLGSGDFSVSFRESMFAQLIYALYQDGILPRRFSLHGLPDPGGPILLEQPRIMFKANGLNIKFRLDVTSASHKTTAILVDATLAIDAQAAGQLHVRIADLTIDIQFPGLGFAWIVNTVTFHLLSALVGSVLSSILRKPISNSLDAGLQAFLNSGALSFGFKAPLRGTNKLVEIIPLSFLFQPGTCTLQAGTKIS